MPTLASQIRRLDGTVPCKDRQCSDQRCDDEVARCGCSKSRAQPILGAGTKQKWEAPNFLYVASVCDGCGVDTVRGAYLLDAPVDDYRSSLQSVDLSFLSLD